VIERRALDSRVHHEVVTGIVKNGHAPSCTEMAATIGVTRDEVASSLARLHESHGLVLHPGTTDVWIAHPFSLSPTGVWVSAGEKGWWAPCLWCATGISAIAARNADVHVRIGAEAESVTIGIRQGKIIDDNLLVHFALPPRFAWNNVVHYCAMVLPFRSEEDVDAWCARHRLPRGAVVPMRQVLDLGRAWYGRHLAIDWVKHTPKEAQAIFEKVGLTGDFWRLPIADDRPF
jgi:hypothetical protein